MRRPPAPARGPFLLQMRARTLSGQDRALTCNQAGTKTRTLPPSSATGTGVSGPRTPPRTTQLHPNPNRSNRRGHLRPRPPNHLVRTTRPGPSIHSLRSSQGLPDLPPLTSRSQSHHIKTRHPIVRTRNLPSVPRPSRRPSRAPRPHRGPSSPPPTSHHMFSHRGLKSHPKPPHPEVQHSRWVSQLSSSSQSDSAGSFS